METVDVLIVGAGPIGSECAYRLSNEGLKVLVLDAKKTIGVPVQCSGLVSPRVLEIVGAESYSKRDICDFSAYAPSGRRLDFSFSTPKACVINRAEFDQHMAKRAMEQGADLRLNHRFMGCSIKPEHALVQVQGPQGTFEVKARVLVGSDGAHSAVRRALGLPGPKELILGIQADIPLLNNGFVQRPEDKQEFETERPYHGIGCGDRINVFLGQDIAPGFFGWSIPAGDVERTGLGVPSSMIEDGEDLHGFMDRLMRLPYFTNCKGLSSSEAISSGVIPLGPGQKIVVDRGVLVGDSGCQVKPISGGGLYPGFMFAKVCTDHLIRCLSKDDLSKKALSGYQKEIASSKVMKELKRGWRIRKSFMHFNDKKVEDLFNILEDPELMSFITTLGDIDFPTNSFKVVLKKSPKFLKFAGPFLKSLF